MWKKAKFPNKLKLYCILQGTSTQALLKYKLNSKLDLNHYAFFSNKVKPKNNYTPFSQIQYQFKHFLHQLTYYK